MTPPRDPARRRFLALLCALAAGGGSALLVLPPRRGRATAERRRLLERLLAGADAGALGEAWFALHPGEGEEGVIADALWAELGPPAAGAASSRQLELLLEEAAREDYRAGRTARLRGWLVSRTEARLAGFAHLRRLRLGPSRGGAGRT